MPRWIFRTQPDDEARYAVLFLTDENLARMHELVRAVASLDVASIGVWSFAEWFAELPFEMPEPEVLERADGLRAREVIPVRVGLAQIKVSRTGIALSGLTPAGKQIGTEEIELVKIPPKPVLPRVRAWDDVEWGLTHRGDETVLTAGVWFDIGPAEEIPRALVELSEERRGEIRAVIDRLRSLLSGNPDT